jgi:hypothetical protein
MYNKRQQVMNMRREINMYRDKIRISEAKQLPEAFMQALEKWREEADKILHSDRIRWYAKLTSTTFHYENVAYIVLPQDVYDPEVYQYYNEKCCLNVLEAGFEILQGMMSRDLKELGAENVLNWGFLD